MGWDYTHATHYTRTGAIDLILTVSNYGGEVTPGNRRLIESILI